MGRYNISFPTPQLLWDTFSRKLIKNLLQTTVIRIPGILFDIFYKDINHYAGKTKERTDRSRYKQVVRRMKT